MPRGTTPFVRKTWDLLANKELESTVSWTRNGESFAILDSDNFAANVLPLYFKHSNLCSFVRQLNTYGFKKVTIRDCNDLEFKHKLFHRDHEELLPHIVRRTTGTKDEETETSMQQEELLYQLVETNKKLTRRLKQLEEQRVAADNELSMMRQELRQTKDFAFRLSVFQRKANYPPLGPQQPQHGFPRQQPPNTMAEGFGSRCQPMPSTPTAAHVQNTPSPAMRETSSVLAMGSSPPAALPLTETSPELQALPFLPWDSVSFDLTEDFFSAV